MSLNNDTQYLSSIPLFSQFSDEHLRLLAFGSDTLRYHAGMEIFKEGQPSDGGFYVIKGKVELTLSESPSKSAVLGPGDLIGEMSMITRNRRVGTAVAKTDCQLLRISRATLIRVLEEFPHLAVGMQEKISSNIQEFTDRLASVEQKFGDAE